MRTDESYMGEALAEAHKALEADEVPIGAIIVSQNGEVIARGYNCVETQKCQLAHAELQAVKEATRVLGDWRLEGCTLFVTLEPCAMCYYALRASRIRKIVFGADSPVFGFHLDKDNFISVYNLDALFVLGGVRKQESEGLLKQFFQLKRKKSEVKERAGED